MEYFNLIEEPIPSEFYTAHPYVCVPIRQLAIHSICRIISTFPVWKQMSERVKILRKIESNVYNLTVQKIQDMHENPILESDLFKNIYNTYIYECNCHLKNNNQLLVELYNDNITIKDFINNKKKLQINPTFFKKQNTFFTCRKCKSKDVTWQETQTRGLDEGKTVFYRCNVCSHQWKNS